MRRSTPPAEGSAAVEAWFAALDHPRADEARALCHRILGLAAGMRQGIRWNAPSFGLPGQEDWLTLRLLPAPAFQLVLHRGARPRSLPPRPDAPASLVHWKGPDRGVVDFARASPESLDPALGALIQAWLAPGLPAAPRA